MRVLLSFLKAAAFVIVPVVSFITLEIILLGRGVPPENVRTLDAFLNWRPDATDFYAIDNPPRLIGMGRLEGFVVSGPAAYVFDETGKMTQWEVETGEGGPVTKLLAGPRKELDREGAAGWLEDRAR